MSYSNPNVELTYDGNGSDDTFGVNFTYLEGETSSIVVEQWDYTDPDNPSQQSFVLNVDYTIDESGYPATQVVTTVPVPVDFKLVVYRSTPKIQTTSLVNGAFPAESVEEMVDRVSFMAQENDAKLDRAILNPIAGPTLDMTDLLNIQSDVGQNQTDIATNASDIATNAADITANQAAIAALAPPTVTILSTASATHNAADGDILIVKASDITVALPAPTINHKVQVKMEDIQTNTIITGTIDGNAGGYTLLSSYESVSLVSDGTQWYII